jgi:hypothetical protein
MLTPPRSSSGRFLRPVAPELDAQFRGQFERTGSAN